MCIRAELPQTVTGRAKIGCRRWCHKACHFGGKLPRTEYPCGYVSDVGQAFKEWRLKMRWIFRRIIDRLLVRSTVQVASQVEAEMNLELGEARAMLLRRVHELEQENLPGLEQVAATLRLQAARMGGDDEIPGGDAARIASVLRRENLNEEEPPIVLPPPAEMSGAKPLALPAPKKRGRPRKDPETPAAAEQEGN